MELEREAIGWQSELELKREQGEMGGLFWLLLRGVYACVCLSSQIVGRAGKEVTNP